MSWASGLTERQQEMLRLVMQAGSCISIMPAITHEAWTVWDGGIVRMFHEATGDALVRQWLIAPYPPARRSARGIVLQRYVPTKEALRLGGKMRPPAHPAVPVKLAAKPRMGAPLAPEHIAEWGWVA